MRIIAGLYRGRPLRAPHGLETRPTTDRVREALFSVLGSIEGARVLDLYAGSGALGLEALSRGASAVTFVEARREAASVLRENAARLGADLPVRVIEGRVERAAPRLDGCLYDLAFCDPPWADLRSALRCLPKVLKGRTAPGARLVLEHPARTPVDDLAGLPWPLSDRRTWGDTAVAIFDLAAGEPVAAG